MPAQTTAKRGGAHEPLPRFTLTFPNYAKHQTQLKPGKRRLWVSFDCNLAHDPKVAGLGMEAVGAFLLLVAGSDEGVFSGVTVKDLATVCHRSDLRQMRRSLGQIVGAGLAAFAEGDDSETILKAKPPQSHPKATPKPPQSHPKATPLQIALSDPVTAQVTAPLQTDNTDNTDIPNGDGADESGRLAADLLARTEIEKSEQKAAEEAARDSVAFDRVTAWIREAIDTDLGRQVYDRLSVQGRNTVNAKRYMVAKLDELRLFAKKVSPEALEFGIIEGLANVTGWSLAYVQTVAINRMGGNRQGRAPAAKQPDFKRTVQAGGIYDIKL